MSKSQPIAIVHFSTSHFGGAGIAARRLSEALNVAGFTSIFMACAHSSFEPMPNEFAIRRSFLIRLKGAILVRIQKLFSTKTYFTLGSIGAIRLKDLQNYPPESSVIHIHNWFNLADLKLFRILLSNGYKLLFTLHDMRLLTGGCHYSLGCNNYLQNCNSCPFLPVVLQRIPPNNIANFRELLKQYSSQIQLVCPSSWLHELAIQSKILPNESIHFIPNVHRNPESVTSKTISIARKNLGSIDIGIASLDNSSPLKGAQFLSSLIAIAESKQSKINFLFLSDFDLRGENQELFWSNIDYLIVPSLADNSPNVIHEAKLRQVPIIATNVGGITELLNQEIDIQLEISDLIPEQFIQKLDCLRLNLDSMRPRFLDSHYLKYVESALPDTVELYKRFLTKNS